MSRELDRSIKTLRLHVDNILGYHINNQSCRCLSDNRAKNSLFSRKSRFFYSKFSKTSNFKNDVGPLELFNWYYNVAQVALLLYQKRSRG